jgi:hypothetical protein
VAGLPLGVFEVGCPRNNQIFFFGSNRNKPKLNLFRLFFGLFCETKKHFFGLFRCFGPVSKQPKQTEKISKKRTNRNKPKLSLFRLFFGVLFSKTKKFFFSFVSMFRTGIEQPKQTELIIRGIKKVDILTNLLLFRLVFCLFRLFRNTKLPVSILSGTTETNILFRIVPKLVLGLVSVVSIRN